MSSSLALAIIAAIYFAHDATPGCRQLCGWLAIVFSFLFMIWPGP